MEAADILLDSWQVHCLRNTRGLEGPVLISILAHAYDEGVIPILLAAFGVSAITTPFICSAGKIDKRGRVCADIAFDNPPRIRKLKPLYDSEIAFRDAMRRLADRLYLADDERVELFALARKWVVADYRLDPTMDRRDPDAKRLTEGVTDLAYARNLAH